MEDEIVVVNRTTNQVVYKGSESAYITPSRMFLGFFAPSAKDLANFYSCDVYRRI